MIKDKNSWVYIGLGVFAVIMIVASFFFQEFTIEVISAKIFNGFAGFGLLYLIRHFDFGGKEWSFTKAIQEGNVSAGIAFAGMAIASALLISSVG